MQITAAVNRPHVVTVTPEGDITGACDLMAAHLPPGRLHLAVSVQLTDGDGRWIVQRRAASKRLFPMRWANSCCTHPAPGDALEDVALRRVNEELGVGIVALRHMGSFVYRAQDAGSGLLEYELDHVFVGQAIGDPQPRPAEVAEVAHLALDDAATLLASGAAAPWARQVLDLAASTPPY